VSNHFGSQAWAAACPRSTVSSTRGLAPAGYARLLGRVRSDGVEKRVDQHVFAELTALSANAAQVKDTGIRMQLGPPPWSPLE
jgi:hypothetical protein